MAGAALACAKKGAAAEGRTIVFVDAAGWYLLPCRCATYAPRGQTPVRRAPLSREHRSVISGRTLPGRLLRKLPPRAYQGPDVVGFLRQRLRQIPGKLRVVWDGAPIQCGQAVKAFLAAGAAERLRREHFPCYAPDVNPDEGIWRQRKGVQRKNVVCREVAALRRALRLAIARLRHKAKALLGCIKQPGYI
ncbi:MAG: transposase [Chloroflexi bacterium]|nr:transposase [Chloroflexota bacterium]